MRHIRLAGEADVEGFRRAARRLLTDGVDPAQVSWQATPNASDDLFAAAADSDAATSSAPVAQVSVPAFFVPLCERAALHADPGRFGLLYRLLWRLVNEPSLRGDPLDPDRVAAEAMARTVRREMHKMTAFVRFRPIAGDALDGETLAAAASAGGSPAGGGVAGDASESSAAPGDDIAGTAVEGNPVAGHGVDEDRVAGASSTGEPHASRPGASDQASELDDPDDPAGFEARFAAASVAPEPSTSTLDTRWHVAWFEPAHHVVEATAPFFARRFAQMRWAILTPERSVRWDGTTLAFGPGARRDDAPSADAGERLWLTYYEHIFNPARLKLAAMKKEMPRRYWPNLPEAALIRPLTEQSGTRADRMVDAGGTESVKRRPRASEALRLEAAPAPEAVAGAPASLAELKTRTQACRECPIGALATQSVVGVGNAEARLMLVGEQPGDQEDLRGQPFVGPAGQLLDRAMKQLGWPRDTVFLTNAVKHFKYELRGTRRIHKTPAQREVAACLHWLESEIDLVHPEAAIALGATAARALMGRAVGVTSERGRWLTRDDGLPVLITLHPSALLRMDPSERDAAFARWLEDLRLASAYVRSPDDGDAGPTA